LQAKDTGIIRSVELKIAMMIMIIMVIMMIMKKVK